ncbi:hypothetical protein BJD55_gp021 [Gordonia phage Yvonnetastic]|uniref:Uncharacterized protein n=1 Tax=Gordonia phage Yvonnetastic TaxID=1821566 RepID=A0A142K9G2_9CAUD|nr:hypothetical protein BJD55_gp021 [Gordonia phage Yvonnetastic]AMS02745.1 hypothetical protein SEA_YVONNETASTIC_201 [Gordonia phage Yvonnetastic]WKW86172.1 hypothetical protein SEA_JONJAMES_200 [Gordonia Phage JonJames]
MNVYCVATDTYVEYFTELSDARDEYAYLVTHTYFHVSLFGDTTQHVAVTEHFHVHHESE